MMQTPTKKVEILNRVFKWCYCQTESWETIGTQLAYLAWAIASNTSIDNGPRGTAELLAILSRNPELYRVLIDNNYINMETK
jgi:hypothetical protein